MNILTMNKANFKHVPKISRENRPSVFDSIVIIPAKDMHDKYGDYRNMVYVLVNANMEPICKIDAGSDIIRFDTIASRSVHWRLDCLKCGYTRVFSDGPRNKLKLGEIMLDRLDILYNND